MLDSTLVQAIITGLIQAAISPQSTYLGVDSTGVPRWESLQSPLYSLFQQIGTDLWKDESFRAKVLEEMHKPGRVDAVCAAITNAIAASVVRHEDGYGSRLVRIDPTLLKVVETAIAEQVRAHPEILTDRIDPTQLKGMTIEVTLKPRGGA